MPFGATLGAEGTRFRFWAPGAARVRLETRGTGQAMASVGDGWHELTIAGAGAGTEYLFVLEDGTRVPDPASRCNPHDVGGPSLVVDPHAYEWQHGDWRGRPWHEAVVYELHLGTFSPEGSFVGAAKKLDYLADLGITAVELMPIADFAGSRNWGYDGVLPFAPDSAYGTPAELKRLIDAAHARGLMVLLDVVYNHFGPEGNFIPDYAPHFFNRARETPWGAAINFDGEHSRSVRDFYVHNALYWIEEYRFDGLRLDAVHAIIDESEKHIVTEIAQAIAEGPGRERHVHLVLENDANSASLLQRARGPHATAQWNDDWHHCAHLLLTGEAHGYYCDYAADPARHFARALAEGFAYQGEPSAHRGGKPRGEASGGLPFEAFMAFLQNHDQVGNRAVGERLVDLTDPPALRLATATLLLSPGVPLIFMGEESSARAPFLFFCDFHGELAQAVREGRKREFAEFISQGEEVPDPTAEATFIASRLPWDTPDRECLERYRALLALRIARIVPLLASGSKGARHGTDGERGVSVDWMFGDGSVLHLRANFSARGSPLIPAPGEMLHTEGGASAGEKLPPWGGALTLEIP
jgi:maltooligosyltrehalose trehalohydrolase